MLETDMSSSVRYSKVFSKCLYFSIDALVLMVMAGRSHPVISSEDTVTVGTRVCAVVEVSDAERYQTTS